MGICGVSSVVPDTVRISDIRPAPYNPRTIDDPSYGALRESIRRLGVVLPLIVNERTMTIIAGHQRSRAAADEGLLEVPCYLVSDVGAADEVRFNQVHNGSGYDAGIRARVHVDGGTGWSHIARECNHVRCDGAAILTETCKLLDRYGNVLSAVVAPDGEVLEGVGYLAAARLLNLDANAYVVDDGDVPFARRAFSRPYGEFSYAHLEKRTYVQGLAQRPRHMDGKRTYRSRLYERLVIPNLQDGWRVLDFGAGYGDYARSLGIETWEPYHHNRRGIDVGRGRNDYELLMASLSDHGLYDAVVCDSVLNSTDCMEAESAVVACLNALTRPGGMVFVSGRPIEAVQSKMRIRHLAARKSWLEYLDRDGFTANLRQGNWYYQHYHTRDAAMALARDHGFTVEHYETDGNAWRAIWRKEREDPDSEAGLRYEGSLPIPRGRYKYSEALVQAWEAAMARA